MDYFKKILNENFNILKFEETELMNYCKHYYEFTEEEENLLEEILNALENNKNIEIDLRGFQYNLDSIDSAIESFSELGVSVIY